MDKLMGTRLTLETQVSRDCIASLIRQLTSCLVQVNTLESANLNAETMVAMRRGADALRGIHNSLYGYPP